MTAAVVLRMAEPPLPETLALIRREYGALAVVLVVPSHADLVGAPARTCRRCGTSFVAGRHAGGDVRRDAIYCSRRCAKQAATEAWRARNRAGDPPEPNYAEQRDES